MATGERGKDQTSLTFSLSEKLAAAIDESRKASRSEWLREACAERLRREGYEVPEAWVRTPDRAGKGGRPRKEEAVKKGYEVPEMPSAKVAEFPQQEYDDPNVIGWTVDREGKARPIYREDDEQEAG